MSQKVKAESYDWSQTKNVARDEISQGDRLKVFRHFLSMAIAGVVPYIMTSLKVSRPDANNAIEYSVRGFGRIRSVLHWNSLNPVERIQEALREYHGAGKGYDFMIADDVVEKLKSLDDIDGLPNKDKLADRVKGAVDVADGLAKIKAAFGTRVKLPVDWSDQPFEEAVREGVTDRDIRENGTVADRLKSYADLAGFGDTKGEIARQMGLAPSRITTFAKWVSLRNIHRISDSLDTLLRLHNGNLVDIESPVRLNSLCNKLKAKQKGAKYTAPDPTSGETVRLIHFDRDEQDEAIKRAYDAQVARHAESKGAAGFAFDDYNLEDHVLLQIRQDDLFAAFDAIEAERKAKPVQTQPVAEGGEQTTGEDGATSETGEQTVPPPAKVVSKPPTHESIVNFLSGGYWKGTRAEHVMAPIDLFARGLISADSAATSILEAKWGSRGSKPEFPTETGADVPVVKAPVEGGENTPPNAEKAQDMQDFSDAEAQAYS